jgi:CRP-like cAMP-binding protein
MTCAMHLIDLAGKSLFQGLSSSALQRVAAFASQARFGAGEIVFRQGEPALSVFYLEQGEVALRLFPEDGGSLTIALIQPEGVFGWSAVLGRARYTCSAEAVTEGQALALAGSQFRALVRAEPDLGRLLLGRLALALVERAPGRRALATARLARALHAELVHAAP